MLIRRFMVVDPQTKITTTEENILINISRMTLACFMVHGTSPKLIKMTNTFRNTPPSNHISNGIFFTNVRCKSFVNYWK